MCEKSRAPREPDVTFNDHVINSRIRIMWKFLHGTFHKFTLREKIYTIDTQGLWRCSLLRLLWIFGTPAPQSGRSARRRPRCGAYTLFLAAPILSRREKITRAYGPLPTSQGAHVKEPLLAPRRSQVNAGGLERTRFAWTSRAPRVHGGRDIPWKRENPARYCCVIRGVTFPGESKSRWTARMRPYATCWIYNFQAWR